MARAVLHARAMLVRPCSTALVASVAFVAMVGTTGCASSVPPITAAPSSGLATACDGGNLAACLELGRRYESGKGAKRDAARAAALYMRACGGGLGAACHSLAKLYAVGKGVPKDSALAVAAIRKACDVGDPAACTIVGIAELSTGVDAKDGLRLLENACAARELGACTYLGVAFFGGLGVAKDMERGLRLVRFGCDQGYDVACLAEAELVEASDPTPAGRARALALYDRACELGEGDGCVTLGERLEAAGDHARVRALFTTGCELGVARSCARLGQTYLEGWGVAVNVAKAVASFERACDGDDGLGCFELAWVLTEGPLGGKNGKNGKNDVRALRLFEKACQAKWFEGCVGAGRMWMDGVGTEADEPRAAELFRVTCDAGHARSCYWYAYMLAAGRGVAHDLPAAAKLCEETCAKGVAEGCTAMGKLYLGKGGLYAPDRAKAEAFLRKACDGGDAVGCAELAAMSP